MQAFSTAVFTWTPLKFFVESLWRDEAFTYFMSILPFHEILSKTAQDFNPPFYYLFMHVWIGIMGGSEISLRTPSLLAFALALYFSDLFFKEVLHFSVRERWMSFILLLLTPCTLYFAFEARMYSLLACLSVISTYSLFSKKPTLFAITTLLGLYTHYFFSLVFLIQGFMLLRHTEYRLLMKSYALSTIAFLPWVFFVIPKVLSSSSSFWIPKMNLKQFILVPFSLLTGYDTFWNYYDKYSLAFGWLIIGLFTILLLVPHRKKESVPGLRKYLLVWGLGIPTIVALISFVKPVYVVRYVLFSTYGLVFLFLYLLKKGVVSEKVRLGVWLLLVLLLGHFDYYMIQFRQRNEAKTYMKILETSLQKGDELVLESATPYFVVRYYIPDAHVKIAAQERDVPQYVGKVLIPKDAYGQSDLVYPNKSFYIDSRSIQVYSLF